MQAAVLALAPGATDATHLMTAPAMTEANNQRTTAINDYGVVYFSMHLFCAILVLLLYVGYDTDITGRGIANGICGGAQLIVFFSYVLLCPAVWVLRPGTVLNAPMGIGMLYSSGPMRTLFCN